MAQTRAAREAFLEALVHDDPVQLYERAPCGFLSTTPDGVIVKCNGTFRTWIGRTAAELVGSMTFADLLTPGGRIYHETHLAPSLRMQGSVREIALDLVRSDGQRLPVLVNATMDRDAEGRPRVVRVAVFDASERREYERELLRAKEAAEAAEQRARSLAHTLQQSLLPPTPPRIPGLEVAAAFHPAGDGLEVGGDFYDVFPTAPGPDGPAWAVLIGDVCGKGAEAAAVATLVRHTVRALTVTCQAPVEVLERLDRVLLQHGTDRFCTLTLILLQPSGAGWEARMGTGGHPPPLLLSPGRPVSAYDVAGSLLGLLADPLLGHSEFGESRLLLAPGDALVLYTDGVTEGRRDAEMYGEERLLADVEARRGLADPADPVRGLVRDLAEGVAGNVLDFQRGMPRDDIAVLAVGVPLPDRGSSGGGEAAGARARDRDGRAQGDGEPAGRGPRQPWDPQPTPAVTDVE